MECLRFITFRRERMTLVLSLATALLSAHTIWAAAPADEVKAAADRVLEILKNPKLTGEAKKKERRKELRNAIAPRFDFVEMSKRSLGHHWTKYPDKQSEFVSIFTDHLEASYVGAIESYKGEKILYTGQRVEGDQAEVSTKIVGLDGKEIPVNYRLRLVDGKWKVYDVIIEGISLVNNFRSQFDRVLASSSFDELLKKLKEKASG